MHLGPLLGPLNTYIIFVNELDNIDQETPPHPAYLLKLQKETAWVASDLDLQCDVVKWSSHYILESEMVLVGNPACMLSMK